ncbi:hypothetical protein ACQP1O_16310 [Nocardia sp. CA-151230]|uniref:hypothetical protein n=1 Tax=Nocardia sp. CA-151230 TaxID=3239982 RepID=UPI003D8E0938
MSVAGFIASQRTEHGVPHAVSCRALEVSGSWFYKWNAREPTEREQRREQLTAAIGKEFEDSGRTYGSPCIGLELREKGAGNIRPGSMPGPAAGPRAIRPALWSCGCSGEAFVSRRGGGPVHGRVPTMIGGHPAVWPMVECLLRRLSPPPSSAFCPQGHVPGRKGNRRCASRSGTETDNALIAERDRDPNQC